MVKIIQPIITAEKKEEVSFVPAIVQVSSVASSLGLGFRRTLTLHVQCKTLSSRSHELVQ